MSERKRKAAGAKKVKRDSKREAAGATKGKRKSKSSAAVLTPIPAELIRFCNEMGLDLFHAHLRRRMAESKTPEDYRSLKKELTKADFSNEDKLRLALSTWTRIMAMAARVIDDEPGPAKFSWDPRLEIRWHRSQNIPIPEAVAEEAEALWENLSYRSCPISEEGALRLAGFRKEGRMRAALLSFGCPEELTKRLTEETINQLCLLKKTWRNALGADRSANRRRRKKPVGTLKTPVK